MRLTLRTLLAYLDGILEPQDAQDIGKKIEESAFASDLIHRIRDLLRRPSVTPSETPSQGPSLGPNAMAEYLDNTLSPDRVTEFEKICLESDIHLAEVAACHQILTLVLGEPAEIDPASRQRMYDISSQKTTEEESFPVVEQPEVVMPPLLPAFSASSTDLDTDRKPRSRPTIPEYLREPNKRNRWITIAAAGVLAVCLLFVLLKASGRFEPGKTMGNLLVHLGLVQEKKEVAIGTIKEVPGPRKTEANTPAKPKSEEKTAVAAPKPSATGESTKIAAAQPPAESTKPSAPEQPSATATVPGKSETAAVTEKTGKESEAPTETGDKVAVPETGTVAKSSSAPTANIDQGPKREGDVSPQPAKTREEPSGGEHPTAAGDSSGAQPAEEQTPAGSERLGRYMSEDQILLRNPGVPTDWQCVPSNDLLLANQQLLALPTYRPDITLGAGVNLRMLGGTKLELVPGNAQEPPGIKIRFGRIVARPVANAGTRLRIIIGERAGVITFSDPEAVVAAEARRIHTPGANPETEPARLITEFFITSGHVLWNEKGQKTLEITGPARFTIEDQLPPESAVAKELPKWIAAEPIGMLERRASATIAQEMQAKPPARPAQRGLMELAEHRQKEVRWLALRCLEYLGYFDPMVTVLREDDAASKQDWSDHIDQLREAVGRDPESAAAVRKSLESRYPQTAAEMYRLLWGYTDKDLESGDDEKLVKLLEDENLALRVLSIWNLKDITEKTLSYQPEQTAAKRQQPVQRWKQRLEAKEIRIKSAEVKSGNAAPETPPPPPGIE